MPTILPDATLFREVAVHCFWAPKCDFVVRDFDAQVAHELMEAHYSEKHARALDIIVGRLR